MTDMAAFVDTLLDDDLLRSVTKRFVAEGATLHAKGDEQLREFLEMWMHTNCDSALDRIIAHSESPLERVFLAALMLGFTKWEPLGLQWTPKFDTDAPAMLDGYRSDHADMLATLAAYEAETGRKDGLMRMMRDVTADDGTLGADATIMRHVLEEFFETWDGMHLTIQPKFTNIRVDGRSIRCDALVWIPADPTFKVVLECDGYEYHSDRPRFTTDRRRDRVLAAHGYKVMRFSGAEVFENPIAAATEAYDFLQSQRRAD